jgi:membrane protein
MTRGRASQRFWCAIHLGGLTGQEAALRTWQRINEHAILTRAAAISFYAIAALIPFLGLLIALTAHWLPWILRALGAGSDAGPVDVLKYLLPEDATSLISRELERLREQPPKALISIGVIALLWLSSSVFVEVIDAMNVIVSARETRPFWKRRLIAVAMTVTQAMILIATMVTIVAWPQIVKLMGLSPLASVLVTVVHSMTVFLMVLFSFAAALQMAPNADQDWGWLTPGSLAGAMAMLVFSLVFRYYVQNWGDYSATHGSLAGIIVLTSWIWLTSVQLLVAAEFNKVIEDCIASGRRAEATAEGGKKFAPIG